MTDLELILQNQATILAVLGMIPKGLNQPMNDAIAKAIAETMEHLARWHRSSSPGFGPF